jgi:hypothetical protein
VKVKRLSLHGYFLLIENQTLLSPLFLRQLNWEQMYRISPPFHFLRSHNYQFPGKKIIQPIDANFSTIQIKKGYALSNNHL